jgi:hypothetical protein
MKRVALAVGVALVSQLALAQKVDPAEIQRLRAEVERHDAELRDRASIIEAELWSRVMAEDATLTRREIEKILVRMEESRKRREAERLAKWQANPYRYEMRTECPPQPTTIFGAMAATFKPTKPCTNYFVRILVNLEGEDVGTLPERIPGYPPVAP